MSLSSTSTSTRLRRSLRDSEPTRSSQRRRSLAESAGASSETKDAHTDRNSSWEGRERRKGGSFPVQED